MDHISRARNIQFDFSIRYITSVVLPNSRERESMIGSNIFAHIVVEFARAIITESHITFYKTAPEYLVVSEFIDVIKVNYFPAFRAAS